jgi:hypothetical protein
MFVHLSLCFCSASVNAHFFCLAPVYLSFCLCYCLSISISVCVPISLSQLLSLPPVNVTCLRFCIFSYLSVSHLCISPLWSILELDVPAVLVHAKEEGVLLQAVAHDPVGVAVPAARKVVETEDDILTHH